MSMRSSRTAPALETRRPPSAVVMTRVPSMTRITRSSMCGHDKFVAGYVLASVLLNATLASAQTPSSPADLYIGAVRTYVVTGDPIAALAAIPGWSQAQFEGAIKGMIAGTDSETKAAAAVLQLEIALGTAMRSPAAATGFLELGEALILDLRSRPRPERINLVTFIEHWYVAASACFLRVNDVFRGAHWSSKGLKLVPNSAQLHLLDGVLGELHAVQIDPAEPTRASLRAVATRQRANYLRSAEASYRRALLQDPSLVPARLRLGRVLFLRGHIAPARDMLARVAEEAQQRTDRYLAAMFTGALLEQGGDLPGAAAAYEEALVQVPGNQAATVAAGHIAMMTGRPDHAHALVTSFLSSPPAIDPWWPYQRGDLHAPSMARLRGDVTR